MSRVVKYFSTSLTLSLTLVVKVGSTFDTWDLETSTSQTTHRILVWLSSSTGNDQTFFLDVAPGYTERSDLLKLLGHNPVNVVKDEDELREHILSLTPSQLHAFELMTDLCDQQRLLFLTGPGGTGKSFLIHTVVGQLTYCQGLYAEVLATSGSAAYLLGGSTIHRFFRLDIEMKSRHELGTVDCSAVANSLSMSAA